MHVNLIVFTYACVHNIVISLKHDLKVLFLDHPRKMIRDTSNYKYFRNAFGGKTPSLKRLSERMLGVKVQVGFSTIDQRMYFKALPN